jgi:hypothetical protein
MANQIGDNPGINHSFQDGLPNQVVINPGLPAMPSDPSKDARGIAAGANIMPEIRETVNVAGGGGGRTMETFKPAAASPAALGAMSASEMQSRPAAAAADTNQGYLLLRVRVINDKIQIISAKTVDGPLAQPASLIGQHAYEVVLDAQQLAVEGIADIAVSRSYPRPWQHEHHIVQRQDFEFNIRIPRSAVPSNALDRIKINLFQFPDALPKAISGRALLSRQFGNQARIIATLDGITADRIEPAALDQLKVIFPSALIR